MSTVYVLHESPAWYGPLDQALDRAGVSHDQIMLDRASIDISGPPPDGVFFNRLSGTAHTRGHRLAVEHCRIVLRWLESHGRRVVNGSNALEIAMSKSALQIALGAAGIRTPRTAVAVGIERLADTARDFDGPFLVKPNRGGKGIGIARFDDVRELARFVESGDLDDSADGVYVVQAFIESADPFITRAEFIGGEFMYALRSATGHGFNLCPADVECAVPMLTPPEVDRFRIRDGFDHPVLDSYRQFMHRNNIEIAAIEFIIGRDGAPYTYDLNINTNYNADAEAAAGVSGMDRMANFLGRELKRAYPPLKVAAGA